MFLGRISKFKQKSRRRKGHGFEVKTEYKVEKNIKDDHPEPKKDVILLFLKNVKYYSWMFLQFSL